MNLKTFEQLLKSKVSNDSSKRDAEETRRFPVAASADRMRGLIKSKLLLFTDLHTNPEKFFLAHRVVAAMASEVGTGFWVRLTVQYNLFAGTVLNLGTAHHLNELRQAQEQGSLGCFCLTEKFAGVHSGLVVNITAEWDNNANRFVINTPNMDSAKNWISQGLVADKAVIVAKLIVNNTDHGIQGFLVNMRDSGGRLLPGISLWNMGPKTVGNDLDNAVIMFKDFCAPKSALLNRYVDVMEDGHMYRKGDSARSFDVVGQQLFSGRVCVAQAALAFRSQLFETARRYAESKQCWTKGGSRKLVAVPHIQRMFEENEANHALCDRYVKQCENELNRYLRSKQLPNNELINDIAIAKIKCVEDSIQHVHALQNEIGSFALMPESGLGQRDFLTCCKFAEGDTRILMQKIARERWKKYQKNVLSSNEAINEKCFRISNDPSNVFLLYDLANLIIQDRMERIVHNSKL